MAAAASSFISFLIISGGMLLWNPGPCAGVPQGLADYSVVIPADGLTADVRYDFWLKANQTFQIVDRTADFSAMVEPPTFSTEAYAYDNPNCDLGRKVSYKQEFSFARPDHIFWRRDVDRDELDGRKYTFTTPPDDGLEDRVVEFCLVVSGPRTHTDGHDPNIVFRRRLQDQEFFFASEHTITIVLHAGARSKLSGILCGTFGVAALSLLSNA
ncbi:conserved hypothetical protein [Neospora caninum Liverpool]|uniref:Toxoplasma gondii family A protein n=1 Tax=Neospora caninum (strain Liverpool) TaxID=572307 RepID=F0VK02_NEOCL|nr:conserved hypothetical protein [Neospora caninum Liverpool]CBZ53232.1 conserved hypothetical protein [Neospora caninum Liverpool]CEL67222.1 TPA: hypothetical protein BN1204_030190 [Neospora caninum Liverpool]|eukprot:XP_003883264.1 conserved hypothetical protein [Neospora caninum Liverpool]